MKIETKFDIWQNIEIIPLGGMAGRIVVIELDGSDLWYTVEYWFNGECKCVKLADYDIEAPRVRSSISKSPAEFKNNVDSRPF